jgi:hypothetical protein
MNPSGCGTDTTHLRPVDFSDASTLFNHGVTSGNRHEHFERKSVEPKHECGNAALELVCPINLTLPKYELNYDLQFVG